MSKSNVKEQFFTNQFTKESVYILGLLWADGYVGNSKCTKNRIAIEMKSSDLDTLIPIFNKTGKWCVNRRQRLNRQPQTLLVTYNVDLWKFLRDCDYVEKSELSANKILNLIPIKLHNYWWRGYFDGDGCLYVNNANDCIQLHFSSSYNQDWSFVINMLDELQLRYRVIQRIQGKNKHSIIRLTSKYDILKLYQYMYTIKDSIWLQRKFDKFQEIYIPQSL